VFTRVVELVDTQDLKKNSCSLRFWLFFKFLL